MDGTQKILDHIILCAKQGALVIDRSSVESFPSTGMMSRVFRAETDRGQAIIHVVAHPAAEQAYQQVPEKIAYVASLLGDIPQVPKIFLTGRLPQGGYFLVQEYKPGKPLGKRSYREGTFVDEFVVDDPKRYVAELQDIALRIHGVTGKKFGYIDFSGKVPQGRYDSWGEFLQVNFERNLETLRSIGIPYFDEMPFEEVRERVRALMQANTEFFHAEKAHLIHGDIFNYSNVLVSETKIEGVIDFEWALFGHPAWEFVFVEHPPLDIYLPQARQRGTIDSDIDFKRSIELHTIFWCAWGASVHAKHPQFGPALYSVFLKNLKQNT